MDLYFLHKSVVKEEKETFKQNLQSSADNLNGRITELQNLNEKFYLAPIPEGVTHMHGIELEPLDWKTRLMVMEGNIDTIKTLGGKIETKEETPKVDSEEMKRQALENLRKEYSKKQKVVGNERTHNK